MKKILIVFLSFFVILASQAKDPTKKFLDKEYIFQPDQFIKWPEKTGVWGKIETHGRIAPNPWNLRYDKEIVRDGKYSLRFEMRDGDCNNRDCDRSNNAGRSEVSFNGDYPKNTKGNLGNLWYAWSLFIPEGTNHIKPAYTILGQFKMPNAYTEQLDRINDSGFDEDCPEIPLLFHLDPEGIVMFKDGVEKCGGYDDKVIVPSANLHNKWHDFLLNVNWTDKEDGFIDLWVNEKKIYNYKGKTIGKLLKRKKDGKKMGPNFRFGIYNGERFEAVKTLVAYFDAFKSGKNCKKTALFHDCKNLPTTNLNIEGRYKLSWYWVDMNIETKKIISDEFIVSDKINIKNGKFFFEKLGSSKIISDKYRKNIKLKQHQDNLEIEGELDLDNDDPSNITIVLENKSSHYEGLGIYQIYEKKTESVKVILTPIN